MKVLIVLSLVALAVAKPEVHLDERFTDDEGWKDRWVQSEHKSDLGRFKLTSGQFYGDEELDKGLQTSQDAKFYAISTKFANKFSNKGKKLVIQFTVKHEQSIDCGGGYVKVFPSSFDQKDLHGESPYNIMFGPDICGQTKKVHVIFSHDGKNHLIKKEIKCKDDIYTHLYTLILDAKDNSYEVLIDNESVEKGKLVDDWDFLPPKKINDPEAKKPSQEEWDEREKIDDPKDEKPEDWDKPKHIPDSSAKKPEDWDDEMDGEWEPPMIDNPDYKGEWKPKKIDNPDYKGKWVHPQIDNPEFDASKEAELGVYDDFGGLGIDVWQVKSGTIFDNFLVTEDVEHAKKVGEETFGATKEPEKKMKEAQDEEQAKKAKEETGNSTPDSDDEEDDDDDSKSKEEDVKESHDEL